MLDTKGCRGQLMNIAQRLLSIDSPSGFTDQVVREAEQIARDHGYAVRRTNKGNLVVSVPGREKGKRVGLCAHIDTLGLMVRSITADGMLMTTRIGGPILPTLDGEYCRIHTRDGRIYTGTILSLSPAAHVFDDVLTRPRDEKNLAVRIDEVVEDRVEGKELPFVLADNPSLWRVVPRKVAFAYIVSDYHQEMKQLMQQGREVRPLFYDKDKPLMRTLRMEKNLLGHFKKFKQYYERKA